LRQRKNSPHRYVGALHRPQMACRPGHSDWSRARFHNALSLPDGGPFFEASLRAIMTSKRLACSSSVKWASSG
jgi:hypothetical protein